MQLQTKTGVIGPFSTVKLTVKWQPTIPGQVVNSFVLSLDDKDSEDVSCFFQLDTEYFVECLESDLMIAQLSFGAEMLVFKRVTCLSGFLELLRYVGKGKGKVYLYSAFNETSPQGARVWITQGCPCKLHHTCLYLANVHQMAPPEWQTSNSSSLLIYRPRKDERLVG